MTPPSYSRIEYERRFLVDGKADWQHRVKPYSKFLIDRYLDCGRLRLRRMEDSDTGRVAFKLSKKYESDSALAQPITTIWLSSSEYKSLLNLPGHDLAKRRYYDEYQGVVFSIDEFQDELSGLVLCESEAASLELLRQTRFPEYARWEVTADAFFTGGSLCRTTALDMASAVARTRLAPPGQAEACST